MAMKMTESNLTKHCKERYWTRIVGRALPIPAKGSPEDVSLTGAVMRALRSAKPVELPPDEAARRAASYDCPCLYLFNADQCCVFVVSDDGRASVMSCYYRRGGTLGRKADKHRRRHKVRKWAEGRKRRPRRT